jgi:hypothetical protein
VNQTQGGRQGNPNYVYYNLAQTAGVTFHSITEGDIDVNCAGPVDCYGATITPNVGRPTTFGPPLFAPDGALSTSGQTYSPAYGTPAGWNFAIGLGSIDASNLVNNWSMGK